MKLRSRRFRDQPIKPLDLAIWWTEYIIRDPNPTHLKSPAKNMGYIKSNLIDVAAFACAFIIFILYMYKLAIDAIKKKLTVSGDKKRN